MQIRSESGPKFTIEICKRGIRDSKDSTIEIASKPNAGNEGEFAIETAEPIVLKVIWKKRKYAKIMNATAVETRTGRFNDDRELKSEIKIDGRSRRDSNG